MAAIADMMSRSRSPRKGPEHDLCKAVLKTRLPTDGRLPRVVFQEPRLPTGFPDIVAVYPTSRAMEYPKARSRLTAQHVRVMHFLHSNKGARLSRMSEMLACSHRILAEVVEQLSHAKMVRIRGAYVSPRAVSDLFVARRIVAIEAKISGWAKAIQQARANIWFASHSYILLPPHRSIDTIARKAKKAGVGVLVFDGETVATAMEAVEHAIPASYGSWLVNEWTLHRLKKEEKP